jgi:ABC-type antimicrobial peptide transport system permease subunit
MIFYETVLQDLRYAARILFRSPGFTFVAVVALALGIGVNTAVFTAYRAMVARSLDAHGPEEMVNFALIRDSGGAVFSFSYPDYEVYRDSMLYGIQTVDGISVTSVSLLFLAIALLAAYPPSRRAVRVDPVVALRYD